MVEGVREAENAKLDQFLDFSIDSIKSITEGKEEGHFALKLTAYISTDVMEKLSLAQQRFLSEVLSLTYDSTDESVLTEEQLTENLACLGVTDFSKSDLR